MAVVDRSASQSNAPRGVWRFEWHGTTPAPEWHGTTPAPPGWRKCHSANPTILKGMLLIFRSNGRCRKMSEDVLPCHVECAGSIGSLCLPPSNFPKYISDVKCSSFLLHIVKIIRTKIQAPCRRPSSHRRPDPPRRPSTSSSPQKNAPTRSTDGARSAP